MTMPEDDDRDALGELAYEQQIEQAMFEAELKRDRELLDRATEATND